jgi:hypothetical protein
MIRHGYMAPPPFPPDPRTFGQGVNAAGPWTPPPHAVTPPGKYSQSYYDPSYYAQHQLRRGIKVACIGLALLIGFSFIHVGTLGPWLLGGLIPLFVGIAQIITAILGGARLDAFGAASQGASFAPPPGVNQQTSAGGSTATPPPPPAPGSYGAWRPGSMPEIEKPAPPPDRL